MRGVLEDSPAIVLLSLDKIPIPCDITLSSSHRVKCELDRLPVLDSARRLRSSWALLVITGFGVLAAVTLMSLGAVYTRALAEAGLQHSLASTSQEILNTHIIAQNRPLGPARL